MRLPLSPPSRIFPKLDPFEKAIGRERPIADINQRCQEDVMCASPTAAIAIFASILSSSLPGANKHDDTLMLLSGNEKALAQFEKAAAGCHLKSVSRIPAEVGTGTWVRVSGSRAELTDKPLNCATRYVIAHMSGTDALSLIGNELR
jgi:hypothetical protein